MVRAIGILIPIFFAGQISFCAKFSAKGSYLGYVLLSTGLLSGTTESGSTPSSPSSFAQTKYTFLTSVSYDGNLGGVAGADTKCGADGQAGALGGTFRAMIVDGTNRIASVTANAGDGQVAWALSAATRYMRSDQSTVIFVTNSTKLFGFSSASMTNSFGSGSSTFWTGLKTDWTAASGGSSKLCDDTPPAWTDANGSPNKGLVGAENLTTSGAIGGGGGSACDGTHKLLCIQQ